MSRKLTVTVYTVEEPHLTQTFELIANGNTLGHVLAAVMKSDAVKEEFDTHNLGKRRYIQVWSATGVRYENEQKAVNTDGLCIKLMKNNVATAVPSLQQPGNEIVFSPYVLPAIDLDIPLNELLETPREIPVSQFMFELADSNMEVPPTLCKEHYKCAGPLVSLLAELVVSLTADNESKWILIDNCILKFIQKCGVGLDNNIGSNAASVASSHVSLTSSRAESERKSVKATRPDSTYAVKGIPVGESQDKDKLTKNGNSNSADPFDQLCESLWLPHHCRMNWRVGMIKHNNEIVFVPMRKEKNGLVFETKADREEACSFVINPDNIWKLASLFVNLAAVFKALSEQIYPHPSTDGKWLSLMRQVRKTKVSRTWVNPGCVHKHYVEEDTRNRLLQFYNDTKDVPGLEQLVEQTVHKAGGKKYDVFSLAPVGIPLSEFETLSSDMFSTLKSDLLVTLTSLHERKYVHLDIRESNVVFFGVNESPQWYLIDSEFAIKLGEVIIKKRYTEKFVGQQAMQEHDFYQLHLMLEKVQKKKLPILELVGLEDVLVQFENLVISS